MMSIQIVNAGRAEEAPVQNHLDLLIAEGVHVGEQFLQCGHIGNVSRKLAIIKR